MRETKGGPAQLRLVREDQPAGESCGQHASHESGKRPAAPTNPLVLQLTALADSLDREVAALLGF